MLVCLHLGRSDSAQHPFGHPIDKALVGRPGLV